MQKKRVIAVLTVVVGLLLSSVPLFAQAVQGAGAGPNTAIDTDIKLLREDVRSERKQFVAANLPLTDAEATKFWPVYDQYAAEMTKISDQRYALIKEYAQNFGSLTDAQAKSLIDRSLALDEAVAQLRIKYVPIVGAVLPGVKTATFFQIDRRITNLIDLQLSRQIPLVQQQH